MKLIVGLGNPEEKYGKTRHNLGFDVLNEFVRKHLGPEIVWNLEDKFKAEIIKNNYTLPFDFLRCNSGRVAQGKQTNSYTLILAKPQTYMNNSGMAVAKLVNYYKIPTEKVIVIHDELDLPLGKIKIRLGGAAAGNHGVESIIKSLGTDKFIRIRVGIGNLKTKSAEHGEEHINIEHFVLSPFMTKEKSTVKKMIKHAQSALEILLKEGLEKAQNQYN